MQSIISGEAVAVQATMEIARRRGCRYLHEKANKIDGSTHMETSVSKILVCNRRDGIHHPSTNITKFEMTMPSDKQYWYHLEHVMGLVNHESTYTTTILSTENVLKFTQPVLRKEALWCDINKSVRTRL
jgi:hypothetical protein